MVIGEGVGRRGEGCIRRLHMLADLKSRRDLTAYLVRENPSPGRLTGPDFVTSSSVGTRLQALQ